MAPGEPAAYDSGTATTDKPKPASRLHAKGGRGQATAHVPLLAYRPTAIVLPHSTTFHDRWHAISQWYLSTVALPREESNG